MSANPSRACARRWRNPGHGLDTIEHTGDPEDPPCVPPIRHCGERPEQQTRLASLTFSMKASVGASQRTSMTVQAAAGNMCGRADCGPANVASKGRRYSHAERSVWALGPIPLKLENGDRRLRGLRALDPLGQEQLALDKDIADPLDAGHKVLVDDAWRRQNLRWAPAGQRHGLLDSVANHGPSHLGASTRSQLDPPRRRL